MKYISVEIYIIYFSRSDLAKLRESCKLTKSVLISLLQFPKSLFL